MWLPFPGLPTAKWHSAAARTMFGEASEVRDIRFEQMLLLDEKTPIAADASVQAPGVVDFVVETEASGEHVRHATAVLHAVEDDRPATTRTT